jgi:hypothetical protein
MWGNTSLSCLTTWLWDRNGPEDRIRFLPREGSVMEALEKAEDPFVFDPTSRAEADHYRPRFAVMNLRDPVVREYWLRRWGEARARRIYLITPVDREQSS